MRAILKLVFVFLLGIFPQQFLLAEEKAKEPDHPEHNDTRSIRDKLREKGVLREDVDSHYDSTCEDGIPLGG